MTLRIAQYFGRVAQLILNLRFNAFVQPGCDWMVSWLNCWLGRLGCGRRPVECMIRSNLSCFVTGNMAYTDHSNWFSWVKPKHGEHWITGVRQLWFRHTADNSSEPGSAARIVTNSFGKMIIQNVKIDHIRFLVRLSLSLETLLRIIETIDATACQPEPAQS